MDMRWQDEWKDANTNLRHENHSPFGEIRRFETKIGDLRESCRFDEKIFLGGGVGSEAGLFIVLRKVLYLDAESLSENLSVAYVRIQYFLTISQRNRDGKGCDWSSNKIISGNATLFDFGPYLLCMFLTLHIKDQ